MPLIQGGMIHPPDESGGILHPSTPRYKRIEFSIENAFDICAIINTDLRLGIPRSDGDILDIMVRKNIIDNKMKEKLKSMRGFRNIIVHRYGGIEDELSYEFFVERLSDFDEFMEKIDTFIRTH